MRELESYTEMVTRHAAELALRREKDRELLALTCRVFVNGGGIEKHPDCTAVRGEYGVTPCLLWRGDVVAEQQTPGIIHVSRYAYPVTPVLESTLRQKGWVKVEHATDNEHVWISRPRLGDVVRRYLKEDG